MIIMYNDLSEAHTTILRTFKTAADLAETLDFIASHPDPTLKQYLEVFSNHIWQLDDSYYVGVINQYDWPNGRRFHTISYCYKDEEKILIPAQSKDFVNKILSQPVVPDTMDPFSSVLIWALTEPDMPCVTYAQSQAIVAGMYANGYRLSKWQKMAYPPRLPGVLDARKIYEPDEEKPEEEEGVYALLGFLMSTILGRSVWEYQVLAVLGELENRHQLNFLEFD